MSRPRSAATQRSKPSDDRAQAWTSARYRRLRSRWVWIVGGSILLAALILDRTGMLLVERDDDIERYHGASATVTRVIDADVIEIDIPDTAADRPVTRVKLWGLTAPKTARGDRPGEPLADDARTFTVELVEDQTVRLHLEQHRPRGGLGRILAHVYLDEDDLSLNEHLLRAGYARIDDRWPHNLMQRYEQLELAARRERLGLWSSDDS